MATDQDDAMNPALLLDRFVGATTAADLAAALLALVEAAPKSHGSPPPHNLTTAFVEEPDAVEAWMQILQQRHPLVDYESLRGSGNEQDDDHDDDEAITTTTSAPTLTLGACKWAHWLLTRPPHRLSEWLPALLHNQPLLVQALVDVACETSSSGDSTHAGGSLSSASSSSSSYTRVLALQSLQALCDWVQPPTPSSSSTSNFSVKYKSLVQQLFLQIPNGLHRLADLLSLGTSSSPTDAGQSSSTTDTAVRNAMLLLATRLAQWPSVAKVWIFTETVVPAAARICLAEGGLTGGSVLVLDALQVLQQLVQVVDQHEGGMLAELVLGQDPIGPVSAQLLNLREGQEYRNPSSIPTSGGNNQSASHQPFLEMEMEEEDTDVDEDEEEDDLDQLIQSANTTRGGAKGSSGNKNNASSTPAAPTPVRPPRLSSSEEQVIGFVLDIWSTLLGDPTVRATAWKQHAVVVRLIWDMALLCHPPPPPPGQPLVYPCAWPSPRLQAKALHVVAHTMADPILIQQMMCRDRLLYLTCTGGGVTGTLTDRLVIAQAALHVLRHAKLLTTEMLLYALAPPPEDDDEDVINNNPDEAQDPAAVQQKQMERQQRKDQASVLPNLYLTVQQQLISFQNSITNSGGNSHGKKNTVEHENQLVGLIGSLSALGLFLEDSEANRTMLLKYAQGGNQRMLMQTPSPAESDQRHLELIPTLLERLDDCHQQQLKQQQQQQHGNKRQQMMTTLVANTLLRFLALWCTEAPMVVYALLAQSQAAVLVQLLSSGGNNSTTTDGPYSSMVSSAGLVLGLTLQSLEDETQASGWSRQTLVQVLTRNAAKWQQQSTALPKPSAGTTSFWAAGVPVGEGPWAYSEKEQAIYQQWRQQALLQVQRAMVQAVTTAFTTPNVTTSLDNNGDGSASTQSAHKDRLVSSVVPSDEATHVLVAQQNEQIQSLREALEKTEEEMKLRDKELTILRLRVESTPTQLDDLVLETTQENQRLQSQYEDMQKEKNEQSVALQEIKDELAATQSSKDQLLSDLESTQQDLKSMSEAYSTLEEEFKREQEAAAAAVEQQKQASAETESVASTQMATLRAENARLKDDAKAANDWMKMAVERMQTLEGEKTAIKQASQLERDQAVSQLEAQISAALAELAQVKEQLQQTEATNDELRQAHDAVHEEKEQHEEEVKRLQQTQIEQQSKLAGNDARIQEQDATIQQLQDDLAAERAAAPAISEEDIQARDEEIAQLRESNDAAQAWMAQAMEHHQRLSEQVETISAENSSLKEFVEQQKAVPDMGEVTAKLAEDLGRDLEIRTAELDALKLEKAGIVEQIDTMKNEHEDEVSQLRTELDQVKIENKELLEKLETLVDGGEMEQELLRKNDELQSVIKELAEERGRSEDAAIRIGDMDMELAEAKAEMQELEDTIAELRAENSDKAKSAEQDDKLADLRTEHESIVSCLHAELNALKNQNEALRSSASISQSAREALEKQIADKTAELESIMVERHTEQGSLKEVTSQLGEVEREMLETKTELEECQKAVAQLEVDNECLSTKEKELEAALSSKEEHHQATQSELQDCRQQIRQLQDLLQQSQEPGGRTQQQENSADALRQIAEWEERYRTLEEQFRDAEARNEHLASRVESSSQTAGERQSEAEADDVGELQAQLARLREEMEQQEEEANRCIEQWQEAYSASEARCKELEETFRLEGPSGNATDGDVNAKLSKVEQELVERDRIIAQWQESYAYLEKTNSELQQQLPLDHGATSAASVFSSAPSTQSADSDTASLITKCQHLESEVSELKAQLSKTKEGSDSLGTATEPLTSQIAAIQEELESSQASTDLWKGAAEKANVEKEKLASQLKAISQEYDSLIQAEQDLQAQGRHAEARIASLEANLYDAQEKILGFESQLADLGRKLISVQTEHQEALRESNDANLKTTELEERVKFLTAEHSSSLLARDELIVTNESVHMELQHAQKDAQEKLERLEVKVVELQSQLQTKDVELETTKQDADEAIQQWQFEFDELQTEKSELDAIFAELQSQYKTQSEQFQKEHAALESLQLDFRKSQKSYVEEKEHLMEQERNLQRKVESLVADSECSKSEANQTISGLEATIRKLQGDLEGLQFKYHSLEKEVQSTQAENAALEANAADASRIGEYLKQNEELKALVENNKQAMEVAQEATVRVEHSLSIASEERSALQNANNQLKAEVSSLEENVRLLQGSHVEKRLFDEEQKRATTFAQLLANKENELLDVQQQAEEAIQEWQESFNALSIEKDTVENEKAQISENLQGLQQQYDDVQQKLSILASEKLSAEVDNEASEALQSQISILESKLQDALSELTTQKEIREADATDSRKKIYELQGELAELQSEMATQVAEHESLVAENKKIVVQCKKMEELEEEITELNSEKERLEALLGVSSFETEELKTRCDLLNGKQLELEQNCLSLQEKNRAQQTKLLSDSEIIAELRSQLETANIALKEKENLLQQLQDNFKKQLEEFQYASTAQDETSEIGRLHVQIQDLKETNASMSSELDGQRKVVQNLENELKVSRSTGQRMITDGERGQDLALPDTGGTNEKPFDSTLAILASELDSQKAARQFLEQRNAELAETLVKSRNESEDVIGQWRARIQELESLLETARSEIETARLARDTACSERDAVRSDIEDQRVEAEEAISSWEEQCAQLEEKNSHLEKKLFDLQEKQVEHASKEATLISIEEYQSEQAKRTLAEQNLEAIQQRLRENEESFKDRIEAVTSKHRREISDKEAQRVLEREHFERLESDFEDMRESKASTEHERDELKREIGELEAELKEANEALQFHLTNEISEQATRIAADALRRQIDDMHGQAEIDKAAFHAEQTARLTAEQEARRLRSDIALLLGMEDKDENQNEIRRKIVEATGFFQRKEQVEIEDLKSTVSRLLEQLNSSRASQTEAFESSTSAHLKINMLEQELANKRSEISFLSQTMEDIRDAESSRRTALEYRISTLEDDQDVVQQRHEAELDVIKNELEQISMDRDRLQQSLKESEKGKEALLEASLRGRDSDVEGNVEMELIRLRMEKAHLLAAASQESARIERRLRQSREAGKSSVEADVLVERELRLAAEIALESANAELREAKKVSTVVEDNFIHQNVDEIEARLAEARNDLETYAKENVELKNQMEELNRAAQKQLDELRDECRTAKAKVLHLERESRIEAELKNEVARLQAASMIPSSSEKREDVVTSSPDSDSAQVSQLYDIIEKQRETIDEERKVHAATNKDFEDLLALLAQKELLQTSLTATLISLGGNEAVEQAVQDAEDRAFEEYGSYVRVDE